MERDGTAVQPRLRPAGAADAPDPATKQALLDRGYALVGSSYDPAGSWWALGSALRDQFEALDAIRAVLPSKPREVIAFGTSMGGLISALESERGHRPHRRRAHHLRHRGRGHRPQQLPAGRRVRDGQAAGARDPDQARALRQCGRRPRDRQAVRHDRATGTEHAARSRASRAGDGLPQRADLGARSGDACARRLRRPRAAAVRHPIQRRVHHDGLHRVGSAVDRAGRGWQRLVDGGRRLRAAARAVALCAAGTGPLPPSGTRPPLGPRNR